jgi:hypothetical protein
MIRAGGRLIACLAVLAGTHLAGADLRIGIVGLDTSHAVAFTEMLNDQNNPQHVAGARVVAAYRGGSPDMPVSAKRIEGFTADLRDRFHVRIVDDIATLCGLVDALLIESVDGRVHPEQARQVLERHKRVFIDKPLAFSAADAQAIAKSGLGAGTPWFTASSLRFQPEYQALRTDEKLGAVLGVEAFGPAPFQPANPGLFWYGIHLVEMLYAAMGPGCESVTLRATPGCDLVVGKWRDGRIATVRGIRKGKADYGLMVFGERETRLVPVVDESYVHLVRRIVDFFQTGNPPVANAESLEVIAFLEAAERSRALGGQSVMLGRDGQ